MARSKTWWLPIRSVLPPDEPLAKLMARLFVVWQDLTFENAGILKDEGFAGIQTRSDELARRLYFVRGNSRTLVNASDILKELNGSLRFLGWLAGDREEEEEFRKAHKALKQRIDHVKSVRNRIGGHVGVEVGESIEYFGQDETSGFEIHGEDFVRPHLARDILLAALCREADPEKRMSAYRAAVEPLAHATKAALRALSIAITVYQRSVGFLPVARR